MCGRYVQSRRARNAARLLGPDATGEELRAPTWNLAPSTRSLIVRSDGREMVIKWPTWGFGEGKLKPINARLETVAQKPYFKDAWRSQRCVVPVDGWYEWKTEHGRKQPYYFQRLDGEPIFFGGLWSRDTFTLLTMAVQGHLSLIHHRRPLSLRNSEAASWIETPVTPKLAESLAVPEAEIRFHPVKRTVCNPRADGPDLILEEALVPTRAEPDLFPGT